MSETVTPCSLLSQFRRTGTLRGWFSWSDLRACLRMTFFVSCCLEVACFYLVTIKKLAKVYCKTFWLVNSVETSNDRQHSLQFVNTYHVAHCRFPKDLSTQKNPTAGQDRSSQLLSQWESKESPKYPRYWSLTNNVNWFAERLNGTLYPQ